MKDYIEIIEKNKDLMIKDLQTMIQCKSVGGEKEGDYPFGEDVHKAFTTLLDMGERDGFTTKNVDNYGGHIEWKGEGQELMGIVGHVDVVPEGSGWSHEPFGGEVVGDKIFGRGAIDDKGPVMAAYYGLKALKEAGFKPKKDIRLIIGLDEETNWYGMDYYLEKEKMPDFGFSPDADFPIIHCEKGLLIFDLVGEIDNNGKEGMQLLSLEGGNAPNMVPDHAAAILSKDPSEIVSKYNEGGEHSVTVVEEDGAWKILSKSVSAHGAQPAKGVNAISVLFDVLGNITFDNEEINQWIAFYNQHIGFDLEGERIGCHLTDEPSGELVFNVGVGKITEEEARFTINIRYPATLDEKIVYKGIKEVIRERGYEIQEIDHVAPLYVPVDDPLVEVLMDAYQKYTGDVESKPLVIGGATYARSVNHSVAYGPVFPGEPQVEHQPDEFVSISGLMKATKIYAEAIYRLTK